MVDNQNVKLLDEVVNMPLPELISKADMVRKQNYGDNLEICSIINAKSGACSEDCKFCAQSGHYNTNIQEYSLVNTEDIINKAMRAKSLGAGRFGIVTSGNTLSEKDINDLAGIIRILVEKVNMNICGSFGALDIGSLKMLQDSGMSRYHHNIETSRAFYSKIVSTHEYEERLNTVKNAKDLGLDVCSGGILGLGEDWNDRLDMALTLKDLNVDSIPLNFLIPIKGTPLADQTLLTADEALRIIILFRLILPNKSIKVMAGREIVLKDKQDQIYAAGANGMLVDGYLTVPGRSTEDDVDLISEVKELWKSI